MMTKFELDGMKNGMFPMDKDEGVKACREYRARLEAEGKRTRLEYFTGDLFKVVVY